VPASRGASPVESRDHPRQPAPGSADQGKEVVDDENVIDPRFRPRARSRRILDAVVDAGESDVAVRKVIELEMIV
jgi:hypothetical protein